MIYSSYVDSSIGLYVLETQPKVQITPGAASIIEDSPMVSPHVHTLYVHLLAYQGLEVHSVLPSGVSNTEWQI